MSEPRKATDITWHPGDVGREERQQLVGQAGATLWMTGLSGSGKSTVACALEQTLLKRGYNAYRLDGDNIRHGLNQNLGFSAEDRTENIRRIGEVAKLFTDACVFTITSFISPYRSDRQRVRELHEAAGLPFIEVFVDCSLEEAEKRDPKGLYRKARAGEIANFTGISDPYETPESPQVHIRTDQMSVEASVEAILGYLREQRLIGEE